MAKEEINIKLAVVQQAHNPGKTDENRAKALAYAAQALNAGAEIILFHEEMLIGYHEALHTLAEPVDGETSRAFQKLLAGTRAKIVYGLTEREGNRLYISAPVVSSEGVIANYRKTHLWWAEPGLRNETAFMTAGDELVTFTHGGQKIGLLICYDGEFPEMFRSYADMGCSVVLWPNNRESRAHMDGVYDAARRNSLIIAASCCCGVDESGRFCRGLSNITDHDGRLIGELDSAEGIVYAEIEPAKALEARLKNPLYVGRRPELYHF